MEEDRRIEKELWNYGIKKYKIIRVISKSFLYFYRYGEISVEEGYEDKIDVKFQYQNKIGAFSISSNQPDNIIDQVIKDSMLNLHGTKEKWIEEGYNESNCDNEIQEVFYTYNKDNFIKWLEPQTKRIRSEIGYEFALVYKISLSQYTLRTDMLYLKEYLANSQITCIANKCKVEVKDRWLYDSFSDYIIEQLKMPILKYKDWNRNRNIIIKGYAVSQIINTYIIMYYSSYVYENSSFIKIGDLGKKLLENDVDIISLPYQNICFDGEGYKIERKDIIQSGALKNLLSNNFFSEHLGIKSIGNADMDNAHNIKHQRLIVNVNTICSGLKGEETILYEFKSINLDYKKMEITGLAVLEDNNYRYLSPITFRLKEFLNKVSYSGVEYKWYDNVFCSDLYFNVS